MTQAWTGDAIRDRREALGLSQAAVAKRAGLNAEVYRRYEVGAREPSITVARTIAEILDLSLAEVAGQISPASETATEANSPSVVGAIIQARRNELGLTQTLVAKTMGISVELYQAYETGDTEIPLTAAAALTTVLDIPLTKLSGTERSTPDLGGTWHTNWQTADMDTAAHPVEALRIADSIALDKGWRGQLNVYRDEVLIGWYRPPMTGIRTRMGVFLWISAAGDYLHGKWTGVADNNTITSGWCVLARDERRSREILNELVNTGRAHPGPNLRLPRLSSWGSGT